MKLQLSEFNFHESSSRYKILKVLNKSDIDAFDWYRRQRFYDPRRAMAIRAWMDGDLRLALRLLQWAQPHEMNQAKTSEKNWNLQAA